MTIFDVQAMHAKIEASNFYQGITRLKILK